MAPRKPIFKGFISNSRGAITVPGSTDSLKCRMIIPETEVPSLLPLLTELRGTIFQLTLTPAPSPADPVKETGEPDTVVEEDMPRFESLAAISPSSSAIRVSGKGGMSVTFDLPGASTHLASLLQLREQMLELEIGAS